MTIQIIIYNLKLHWFWSQLIYKLIKILKILIIVELIGTIKLLFPNKKWKTTNRITGTQIGWLWWWCISVKKRPPNVRVKWSVLPHSRLYYYNIRNKYHYKQLNLTWYRTLSLLVYTLVSLFTQNQIIYSISEVKYCKYFHFNYVF